MNIYYVYQYLRTDGTPYYIGKGCNRRAWVNQRSVPKPTDETLIQIIKDNLSEDEAYLLETQLISQYGRKNNNTGILRNLTDGGRGGVNVVNKIAWNKNKQQTEEHNKKISNALKNRKFTDTHKENISKSHKGKVGTFLGKHHTTETKEKLRNINLGKKLGEMNSNHKQKISDALKGKSKSKNSIENQKASFKGNVWWTNGEDNKLSKNCPGPEWYRGRVINYTK